MPLFSKVLASVTITGLSLTHGYLARRVHSIARRLLSHCTLFFVLSTLSGCALLPSQGDDATQEAVIWAIVPIVKVPRDAVVKCLNPLNRISDRGGAAIVVLFRIGRLPHYWAFPANPGHPWRVGERIKFSGKSCDMQTS